jgi:hypothetical protein
MKIGQRINIIRKSATRLAELNFSESDLILRQFGFPWSDSWQGDASAYYLKMLEGGDDKALLDLFEYFFPSDALPDINQEESKSIWSENTLRLFLSHSSTKKLIVTQIKKELKEYGIECFIAHEDIMPTKEWLREIRNALNSCHAVAAFLCSEFKKSDYCDQEIGIALQRNVFIIPVRLEEATPHGFMAPFQGVTVHGKNPHLIASEIYNLVASNPTTKILTEGALSKTLESLVDDFLKSSNYSDSTDLLKKLEYYSLAPIPMPLIQKIASNWEKNDQITGCNGIPWRMQRFLKRYGIEITV